MTLRMSALAVWLALLMMRAPAVAAAQEAVAGGSISGRVIDPQGAVVPGASVRARRIETNVSVESATDQSGRFRFPNLPVGRYELTVRRGGFSDVTQTIVLGAGSAFDIPVSLTIAAVGADVTVTAEAPVIETARSQIAATIPQQEVQNLPLNGRNVLDVALLAPGVSPTNVATTQLFAETSAVPGGGFSVASQRNFSNSVILDGLSANDDAAGLTGIPPAIDAVEQVQVVTSGGQAELGRALGGYLNVITRSGSNSVQGSAYEFFRNDALMAANPLTGTTLPLTQHQFGGSLGGPLRRDRTFYFANVERRQLTQTGLVIIPDATVSAINARLATAGYPGAPISTGAYDNPVRSTNVFGRLDHELTSSDHLSARYTQYSVTSDNSRGAGGLSAPTASAALDDVDRSLSVSSTWTLSARTVNETRAQVVYGDLEAPPTDPVGPAVNIAGAAIFGTLSSSPTRRTNTMYEIVDNVFHQRGAHGLRAGVDFLYNDDTITFPRSGRGSYLFSSVTNFNAGKYNNAGFTQTFGATGVRQTNPNLGLYAQDEWQAARGVTINAGVRYDLQFLETIATDANNIAPRLGIAWTPDASARTVIRGSAGLFYDRVPLRALANALLSAGNTSDLTNLRQTSISLSPGQAGAPVFPQILSGPIPSVTLTNLTTMDPHMQNAYSRQASVEVERELGRSTTLGIGYEYLRGVDLIVQINQNVPSCPAGGTNNQCRPIAAYANDNQYSPRAESAYHGLHVSLTRRPGGWGYYRVSYALSRAMDDVGEFFFSSPIDPFDLSKDWGRSDDDQRHRLVVNGGVTMKGFLVGGVLQYYSALPLNITSGVTTIQGTAGRPIVNGAFIERNSGVGPDFFTLNGRVARTMRLGGRARLEAIAEVFNLTNRQNAITVNGNFGPGAYPASPAANFGQVTAVGDPRAAQVALRITL